MSIKSAAGIVFALVVSACPLALGTASAAERTDRPAKEAAGAANVCSPVLNGEWICRNAQNGELSRENLSLETDGSGATRLVKRWGGASRGSHDMKATYVADGRRRVNEEGDDYAASCNHRTKTQGNKIFRIAEQFTSGRAGMKEYVIMDDGRMLIGGFGGTMDGWDVKNSDRPPEPDWYYVCAKEE